MNEDTRTYGFIGDRGRWIRWEFAVLLGYWLFRLVLPGWIRLGSYRPSLIPSIPASLLTDVGYICIILWLIWMSGDDFEMFGISAPKVRDLVWGSILFVAVFIEHTWTHFRQFKFLAGGAAAQVTLVQMFERFDPLGALLGLSVYLIPAAYEELFYRGVIQARILEISRNGWVSIGGTALIFATSHLYQGLGSLPFHLGFGLAFSFARSRGCSLWPLIAAHAIANAFTFAFPLVGPH